MRPITLSPLRTKRPSRFVQGFTLVELIVVIFIMIVLGVIGMMTYSGVTQYARDASRLSSLTDTVHALQAAYPKTLSFPLPDAPSVSIVYGSYGL